MTTTSDNRAAFDPEMISQLTQTAASLGISKLHLKAGETEITLEVHVAQKGSTGISTTRSLLSDIVGNLHWAHPDRSEDVATSVKAGQAFAYLESGGVILPQFAPCSGVVVERLAAAGDLVGYGTPLVTIREQA
ncbi:Hypothetical protein AT6N2_L1096 [Agrobacterium tumefaciens]|uniref:hypothetical protein n=1 Tax=Agrobacterium tumefaciens TaxID=358 RepID=UPI001ADABA18|nr:hypothetical protein [Agrobacterium tumefaciens]QTK81915.1 Hypothetical protein AT6N2_L1096 [Agrobacterium tumefaciens]